MAQKSDGYRLELNEAAFPNIPTTYAMRPNGGDADSAYSFSHAGSTHGAPLAALDATAALGARL